MSKEALLSRADAELATCGAARIERITTDLIAFATVAAVEPPATSPAFAAMADYLKTFAESHGLAFAVSGPNDAWEISLGQGEPLLAFITHGDVVPAAEVMPADASTLPAGWQTPPFHGTVSEGRLYGRGSEDDKGPMAAVLVLFEILARLDYAPSGVIKLVIGNGEEHDWDGMIRYAQNTPPARYTISLDADYPLVVGESGFVTWGVGLPREPIVASAKAVIRTARAGEFLTQIPGEASLELVPATRESVEALYRRVEQAIEEETQARKRAGQSFRFEATHLPDAAIGVRVLGSAAHSSVPEEGQNALWALAGIAARMDVAPTHLAQLLQLVHERFDNDHFGTKLGLAYTDDLMGPLVVAPDLLRVDETMVSLAVNMRRPRGMSHDVFATRLQALTAELQQTLNPALIPWGEHYVGDPAVADLSGPLVNTLLASYRHHTGDTAAQPHSIRGGTFARLFPSAVDFGPSFPGKPYMGHRANEYVEPASLTLSARMLMEALLVLAPTLPPVTRER